MTNSGSRDEAGGKWRIVLRVLALPLLLGVIALACGAEVGSAWLSPSLAHPLGTDEFGRDLVNTAIHATFKSFLKGLLVTSVVLLLALIIAELATISRVESVSAAIKMLSRIVESVPIIMWVLIVVIVFDRYRSIISGIAFAIVVLPTAVTVLSGELLRLRHIPYIEAAYLMGIPELRVLVRHILPGMGALLLPFAIQTLGGAIAVDGAIGVIGQGSRFDLDLGTFLIRGKENFQLRPQVLLVALLMYLTIYFYLLQLAGLKGRVLKERG